MKKIDIIIPSYNARYLLEKHLPQVIAHTPELGKLIIVDDGGSDDTKEFLAANYKEAIYLYHPKNQGFPISVNQGIAASKSELFILLNNDVSPSKDYVKNALHHFDNPKVFAVSFNEINSSWPHIRWDNGKIGFSQGEDKTQKHLTAWASGGSAIFRRSIWDKLGGLNEIYSPGYWEDIDIGWRAWKMGYRLIWEPKSLVDHQHESSFKKLNQKYISLIRQRNELLFHWQNITDQELLNSHFRFLFKYTLTHPGYIKVIFAALRQLPQFKRIKPSSISDIQIISTVDHVIAD